MRYLRSILTWYDRLYERCPICQGRMRPTDAAMEWHVQHLGESVRIHVACRTRRPMEPVRLGTVVRT